MSEPNPKIYLLPNLMTMGNLFCGFTATLKIVEGALMQAANADAAADLTDSPYVWFMFHCGTELHPGVVRGKVIGQDKNNVAVNASVPGPSARGACELQMRISDSGGIESNTLKLPVDLKN